MVSLVEKPLGVTLCAVLLSKYKDYNPTTDFRSRNVSLIVQGLEPKAWRGDNITTWGCLALKIQALSPLFHVPFSVLWGSDVEGFGARGLTVSFSALLSPDS